MDELDRLKEMAGLTEGVTEGEHKKVVELIVDLYYKEVMMSDPEWRGVTAKNLVTQLKADVEHRLRMRMMER